MKLVDKERVDQITIGRRVVNRTVGGQRVERTYRVHTAVYKDTSGKWVADGLGTSNKTVARRKAVEIATRLDAGARRERFERLSVIDLADRYEAFIAAKGLAKKSVAKYKADLSKLREFVGEDGIDRADRFDESVYYRYRGWLAAKKHKQAVTYADKTLYTTLTLCKQVFKWGTKQKLIPAYLLGSAELPRGHAKPQPCFTTEQVNTILANTTGIEHAVFCVLAFSGMRVGELVQLRWDDVLLKRGKLGVFYIRRGGSTGSTKDKDHRVVPIHERIRPVLDSLPRASEHVLPGLKDRWVLAHLKALCRSLQLGTTYKTHSFRHFFASMCANSSVPYRMTMAWLGHSSSDIVDLYYHLDDETSHAAMAALAGK